LLLVPRAHAQEPPPEADRLAALEDRISEARSELLPYLAPRAFQEALELLGEARDRIDRGDAEAEVTDRLRRADAALDSATAIAQGTRSLLATGLQARRRAVEARAASRAPGAWAEAEDRLIEAGRDAEEGSASDARDGAAEAARGFRRAAVRALGLGALADSLRQNDGTAEALLLAWHATLGRLADSLDADPDALAPDAPESLVDAVSRALDARRAAEDSLRGVIGEREERITVLEGRIDSLDRALSRSEVRGETLSDALERRAERRRRIDQVRAMFDDDEAIVRTSADTLTLRVVGLAFPSGSDELTDESEPLMARLVDALGRLPESRLRIEGHTDSRGDANQNQLLSRRRAEAVREVLLERLSIGPERITAEGFGESRPVASNDSAAGRALNRRIDVKIVLPGGG
jgi:outer membrane protein OmpA-like peptidoglycan-associated protein